MKIRYWTFGEETENKFSVKSAIPSGTTHKFSIHAVHLGWVGILTVRFTCFCLGPRTDFFVFFLRLPTFILSHTAPRPLGKRPGTRFLPFLGMWPNTLSWRRFHIAGDINLVWLPNIQQQRGQNVELLFAETTKLLRFLPQSISIGSSVNYLNSNRARIQIPISDIRMVESLRPCSIFIFTTNTFFLKKYISVVFDF